MKNLSSQTWPGSPRRPSPRHPRPPDFSVLSFKWESLHKNSSASRPAASRKLGDRPDFAVTRTLEAQQRYFFTSCDASSESMKKIKTIRGPQMGGQIRRGRIWRFWGRPNFQSRDPQIPFLKGFGTSGRKIGAPQKRQIQPRQI